MEECSSKVQMRTHKCNVVMHIAAFKVGLAAFIDEEPTAAWMLHRKSEHK